MAKVSISILDADYGKLQSCVDAVSNADAIQYDVMDGHFVPNLSMGPKLASSLKTKLFKEAHLMVSNPSVFIKPFADAGMDRIIFHVEVKEDKDKLIKAIKALGKEAGMAVSMKTPIKAIFPYLEKLDMVIIMPITPGFGGQAFDPAVIDKIKEVRKRSKLEIQVDGGINDETGKLCIDAGADNLLVGTFIWKQKDPRAMIAKLKRL